MNPILVLALFAIVTTPYGGSVLVSSSARNASLSLLKKSSVRHITATHRANNCSSSPSALVDGSIETSLKSAIRELPQSSSLVTGKTSNPSSLPHTSTAYIQITATQKVPGNHLSSFQASAVIPTQTMCRYGPQATNTTESSPKPHTMFRISASASTIPNVVEIIVRALNTLLTLYVIRIGLRILRKSFRIYLRYQLRLLIALLVRYNSTVDMAPILAVR